MLSFRCYSPYRLDILAHVLAIAKQITKKKKKKSLDSVRFVERITDNDTSCCDLSLFIEIIIVYKK